MKVSKGQKGQRLYRGNKTWAIASAIFGASIRRAMAQSCAMCYQNAAASGPRGRVALQHGILILALPAIAIFLTILFLLYIRQKAQEDLQQPTNWRGKVLQDEGRKMREVKA